VDGEAIEAELRGIYGHQRNNHQLSPHCEKLGRAIHVHTPFTPEPVLSVPLYLCEDVEVTASSTTTDPAVYPAMPVRSRARAPAAGKPRQPIDRAGPAGRASSHSPVALEPTEPIPGSRAASPR